MFVYLREVLLPLLVTAPPPLLQMRMFEIKIEIKNKSIRNSPEGLTTPMFNFPQALEPLKIELKTKEQPGCKKGWKSRKCPQSFECEPSFRVPLHSLPVLAPWSKIKSNSQLGKEPH